MKVAPSITGRIHLADVTDVAQPSRADEKYSGEIVARPLNRHSGRIKKLLRNAVVAAILTPLLGCAVTPRVSTWQSPQRFTQKEVFNAALQAGSDEGMQLAGSDRESGTASFRKRTGEGEMVLSVTVREAGGMVQVRTTASYGGGVAIRGLHEEYIRNFHVLLFRSLGISDPSERKVNIEELK